MGISGISLGSLLIILLIVMLLFGTKRMRTMGEDLGEAVKGFKKGIKEIEAEDANEPVAKAQAVEEQVAKEPLAENQEQKGSSGIPGE